MFVHKIIAEAKKYLANEAARLALEDAMVAYAARDMFHAKARALHSLAYSVGNKHSAYIAVASKA